MGTIKVKNISNINSTKSFTVDEVRAMLDKQAILDARTMQDVKAIRALDTLYTNNTGADIVVHVTVVSSSSTTQWIKLNGVNAINTSCLATGGQIQPLPTFTVPNGVTYQIVSGGIYSNNSWVELR